MWFLGKKNSGIFTLKNVISSVKIPKPGGAWRQDFLALDGHQNWCGVTFRHKQLNAICALNSKILSQAYMYVQIYTVLQAFWTLFRHPGIPSADFLSFHFEFRIFPLI